MSKNQTALAAALVNAGVVTDTNTPEKRRRGKPVGWEKSDAAYIADAEKSAEILDAFIEYVHTRFGTELTTRQFVSLARNKTVYGDFHKTPEGETAVKLNRSRIEDEKRAAEEARAAAGQRGAKLKIAETAEDVEKRMVAVARDLRAAGLAPEMVTATVANLRSAALANLAS